MLAWFWICSLFNSAHLCSVQPVRRLAVDRGVADPLPIGASKKLGGWTFCQVPDWSVEFGRSVSQDQPDIRIAWRIDWRLMRIVQVDGRASGWWRGSHSGELRRFAVAPW
jgi:hypothetical protein